MRTNEARANLIESHLREAVRMGIGWPRAEYLDRWIQEQVAALSVALGKLPPETEWEYGAGYEADNGLEMRWFSMGGAAYTVREAAENEVARFDDPQVRLVRRAKPGPWVPVEGEVR